MYRGVAEPMPSKFTVWPPQFLKALTWMRYVTSAHIASMYRIRAVKLHYRCSEYFSVSEVGVVA